VLKVYNRHEGSGIFIGNENKSRLGACHPEGKKKKNTASMQISPLGPGRLRGTLDGFHFHHVQYFSRSSELNPGAVSYLHTHTHAPFDHVSTGDSREGNAGGRAWTPYFYPHGASPELPFCFDSASPLVVEPNGGAFRGDGEVPGQEVIAAGAGQGSAGMNAPGGS
jgi:hypothetical protein